MTHLRIGNNDLSDHIWNDTHVHDATLITIDRAVVRLDPKVRVSFGGPGDTSGITWRFIVQKDGSPSLHERDAFTKGVDEKWEISLSYRGPLITAISWQNPDEPEDMSTSPALVAMAQKLADDLRLTYLDAHELMALEIPWDELQGNAADRLDYCEMPNAFNLLFYEY